MARRRDGGGVSIRLSISDGETVRRALTQLGAEGEAALKRIERAGLPASRGLQAVDSASKEAQAGIDRLAARAGPLGRVLTSIGPGGLAAAAGVGAFVLALRSAIAVSREAVAEFDRIAKQARTVGLDSDIFQGLQFGALEEGIGADQLNTALQRFTVESGRTARGQGELFNALNRTNTAIAEQFRLAGSQEERLRLVARAMGEAESESAKAEIAAAAFGRGQVDMVRILGEGERAIDDFVARGREMGLVIERDMLARSEELSNQMDVAARVIDLNFKQALVDLAPILVAASGMVARLAGDIAGLIDSMRGLENQSSAGLDRHLADLGRERLENERRILELRERGQQRQREGGRGWDRAGGAPRLDSELALLEERQRRIEDEEARILAILETRRTPGGSTPTPDPDADARQAEINRLREAGVTAAMRLAEAETHLNEALARGEITAEEHARLVATARDLYRERGQAARDSLSPAQQLIAALEREIEAMREGDPVKREMIALRGRLKNATTDEIAELENLIRTRHAERLAQEAAAQAMREAERDMAGNRAIVSGAISDIRRQLREGRIDWEDFGQAALNVLDRVIDKLLNEMLDAIFQVNNAGGGAGGLGGLVSSLLGGGASPVGAAASPAAWAAVMAGGGGLFSSGTPNTGGRRGEVRGLVHGQEAVIPLPNGGHVPVELRDLSPASAPMSIRVEVIDRAGVKVEAGQPRREADGALAMPLILSKIEDQIAGSVHSGRVGKAMQQTFGLSRVTR